MLPIFYLQIVGIYNRLARFLFFNLAFSSPLFLFFLFPELKNHFKLACSIFDILYSAVRPLSSVSSIEQNQSLTQVCQKKCQKVSDFYEFPVHFCEFLRIFSHFLSFLCIFCDFFPFACVFERAKFNFYLLVYIKHIF